MNQFMGGRNARIAIEAALADVLREPGFYWVQLGQNPAEVACWQGGEWFLTGNDQPWQPEAVEVLSERLVLRPALRLVE